MRPFTSLTAAACPLRLANVDTDQLIPARFMRRPRSEGYGSFLLHDLRFDAEGRAKSDSPVDEPAFSGCEILVARRNFGCGSSREAAVYALADFGIRAVVAPSFGDIFASNAIKNGLLPACIAEADTEALIADASLMKSAPMSIDLTAQTVTFGNRVIGFTIDPVARTQLLNGWDDIDLTMAEADGIAEFTRRDTVARPWMQPIRSN